MFKKILAAVMAAAMSASLMFTMNVDASILYEPSDGNSNEYDGYCWYILQLEGDPVSLYEGAKKMGVHDFILTDEGKSAYEKIKKEHSKTLKGIEKLIGESVDVKYEYTAALNGMYLALKADDAKAVMKNSEKLGLKKCFPMDYAYNGSINKVYNNEETAVSEPDYSQLTQKIAELSGQKDVGEKGENMVIAIIDSEFDINHEYFSISDDTEKRLTKDYISQVKPYLTSGKYISDMCYVSDKIPFAFNYGSKSYDTFTAYKNEYSHGSHVAGIAAGNGKNVSGDNKKYALSGVAPEAQLVLLSVGSITSKYAIDDSLAFAAYDDALYLDADVINTSFGSSYSCYNSTDPTNQLYYELAANIANTGTVFCCAAGNEGRLKKTDHPDYSTGGEPNQMSENISVASAQNPVYEARALQTGSGDTVYYVASSRSLADEFAGQTLEYVVAPDTNNPDDLDEMDIKEKIVVAISGFNDMFDYEFQASFSEALGVIFITDESCSLFSYPAQFLPCGVVRYSDKYKLLNCKKKTLTFSADPYVFVDDDININDFSSWDYTETLNLKPDIASFGGGVLSSVSDVKDNHKSYMTLDGTSMASPYLSGLSILLLQHLKSDPEKYAVSDRKELSELAIKLMMSTAQPIYYSNEKQTASPRVQGNGLANIKNAEDTPCCISTNSQRDCYRPKLSLGDGYKNEYTLEFNVTNLSGKACGYSPEIMLFRDDYDNDGYVKDTHIDYKKGTDFDIVYRDESGEPITRFVVKKGETKTFTAEITLSDKAFNAIKADEGAFVEGFLKLKNKEYPSLTLSFMAYDGDFGKMTNEGLFAPQINGNIDYMEENYPADKYSYFTDGMNVFGKDPFNNSISEDIYVSPNGDGLYDKITAMLVFNRRCQSVRAEVTDKKGNVVYSEEYGSAMGYPVDRENYYQPIAINYDFSSGGKYTLKISAKALESSEEYSITQNVIVDDLQPDIEEVGIINTYDCKYYMIKASDNCKFTGVCTDRSEECMVSADEAEEDDYIIIPAYCNEDCENGAEVYDMAGNYSVITDDDVSFTLTLERTFDTAYAAEGDDAFNLPYTITDEDGNPADVRITCNLIPSECTDSYEDKTMDIYIGGAYYESIGVTIGVLGDANGDGKCNVRDAAYIAKFLSSFSDDDDESHMDSLTKYLSDYNRDDIVNVRDAAAIARFLAAGSN